MFKKHKKQTASKFPKLEYAESDPKSMILDIEGHSIVDIISLNILDLWATKFKNLLTYEYCHYHAIVVRKFSVALVVVLRRGCFN